MTDLERRAEEYADEQIGCGDGYYEWTDVKQAYLAGLHEGQPKWHDLRKDPNDLPKEDCEVIAVHQNGNKHFQHWKNGNWRNAIVIPIILWQEINLPQFKE